jgi:hypothetical protein
MEQHHTEVGGYMCNPMNTKMLKVYRKGTLPRGTWAERRRKKMGSACSIDVEKEVNERLAKTCTKCLDQKLMTSGTILNSKVNSSTSEMQVSTNSFN